MQNKKVVIGILASSNYLVTNDSFEDKYIYGNNYIKKIYENGAIPLLIPFCDEKIIKESLDMCDGLLFPGGSRVRPVFFEVIDYFVKNKKPILGICLGMQTLAMYSINIENEEPKRIIKKTDSKINHWPFEVLRENNEQLVHKDYVKENSKLFKIFKNKEIMVNSLHKNTITEVGSMFDISIRSEDGLIEGIEYKNQDNFIVGVQFHPEILPQFNNLFKEFISNCQKYKLANLKDKIKTSVTTN